MQVGAATFTCLIFQDIPYMNMESSPRLIFVSKRCSFIHSLGSSLQHADEKKLRLE